jgi:thioester reductase-like protein
MTRLCSSTALPWYQRFRISRPAAGSEVACIHQPLQQQARRTPQRAVLVDESGYLSYEELCRAIRRRAFALLGSSSHDGASPYVGVLLDNGIEKIVTYFACLEAGLVYLPLERYHASALDAILAEVPLRTLVTTEDGASQVAASNGKRFPVFVVGDSRSPDEISADLPEADPTSVAHVAFTSGTSSGIPKGVLTDHVGSVLSHAWRRRLWPCDPGLDVVGCNIFGIWDVVPALWSGVPVVLISDDAMKDPLALSSCITRHGITQIMMTPSLLSAGLANEGAVNGMRRLRRIVLCGEPVTPDLIDQAGDALNQVQIGNLYSLAECHDVAGCPLTPGKGATAGKVADFAEVYLYDPVDCDKLVPVGEPGRIFVGGSALARGYFGDTDATASAFQERLLETPNGKRAPVRVYDTGDLGLLHANGDLEIVGRCDAQVKIRGMWVDLAQVERVIREHPAVHETAVYTTTEADGQNQLCACVVPRDSDASVDLDTVLRSYLAAMLPPHCVPTRIACVREIPLLPSGKVDRQALQAGRFSALEKIDVPSATHGAETATSHKGNDGADESRIVLDSFRETLSDHTIEMDDDFFDAGGHSLRAVMLCGELQRRTARQVSIRSVFEHPTPRRLANYLHEHPIQEERTKWPPDLDLEIETVAEVQTRRRAPETVLVTGATGFLGSWLLHALLETTELQIVALVRAQGCSQALDRISAALDKRVPGRHGGKNLAKRVRAIPGDLSQPGLPLETLASLADEVDAVCHLAVELDIFATYDEIEAVNVAGTKAVLRFAARSGLPFVTVSSSAVFPLGSETGYDEETFGLDSMRPLASTLERSGVDGYSLSKYAAELLAWSAQQRGLPVHLLRVPHILGHSGQSIDLPHDRLTTTLQALAAANVFPEGDWGWQFVPVDLVYKALVKSLLEGPGSGGPVEHVTLEPLSAAAILDLFRARWQEPQLLSLPALAADLSNKASAAGVSAADEESRAVATVSQLVSLYGPRAALNTSDAHLQTRCPPPIDPGDLLARVMERM